MPGGIATPDELRRIADVAEKYDVPLVKLTGGQRIDLVGVAEGGPARRLARPRHAGGLRLGQELPHLQELHRHRLLPLRPRRQHGAGGEDREALPRPRQPGQAEAGHRRLPAQLLGGAGQGRRRGRGRAAASGRSTSAAPPARTSARATCCAWSTATTRCCGSAGRFIQYYRENAKYKERTYTFVERVGIERIRAIVVDDSERHGGRARSARCRNRSRPTRDPWLERDDAGDRRTSSDSSLPVLQSERHGDRASTSARSAQIPPGEGRNFEVGGPQGRGLPQPRRPRLRHPGRLPAPGRPAGRRAGRRRHAGLPAARVEVRSRHRPGPGGHDCNLTVFPISVGPGGDLAVEIP